MYIGFCGAYDNDRPGEVKAVIARAAKQARKEPRRFPLQETLLPARVEGETLELDELGSVVLCKRFVRWIWLALCRRTPQVVAYAIGDWSEVTCRILWQRIPAVYKKGIFYTDFLESYRTVLPRGRHRAVGKESGETNHVERFNCTLRQRNS